MAAKCGPPKTVSVKSYVRGAGKKRRRRRKHKKPAAGGYWTCVNVKGRSCGTHHRTFTAAVRHRKRLDRLARAARARNGGPLNDWIVEKR